MRDSYRSFFIKLVVFVAILVVVDFGVGKGLSYLRYYTLERNPYHVAMKTPYMVEKANEDILVVGASDASHHYIPKMISDRTGMSVYNCGQDGRFFLYQNCLIHMTLQRYSPKVIIWQFGVNYLTTSYDEKYEYQGISSLYPYYPDAYCREIINGKSKFKRVQMLSSSYRHNSKILGYLIPLIKYQSFDHGYVPIENTGYSFPNISQEIDDNPINTFKIQRLVETIKCCKEKDVKLILSVAPSYHDKAIYNTPQYNKLISIAAENNVPIIEAREYYQYFQDSSLFKDNMHMNEKGAKLWMYYFIPKLKTSLGIQ